MSEFTRLAGLEPLYKTRVRPKIDKDKAREAARIEMARLAKEHEHTTVLDKHTRNMAGLDKTKQAAILDVADADENLDMPESHPGRKPYPIGRMVPKRKTPGDCRRCWGTGDVQVSDGHGESDWDICNDCNGTGDWSKGRWAKKSKHPTRKHPTWKYKREDAETLTTEARPRRMTKAQSVAAKKAFVARVREKHGISRGVKIDHDEYPPIKGMEGPFAMKTKSGRRILYFDNREGQYYDRKDDMYVPASQMENVQRIAKFNESGDDRYEIVVNGKLYRTSKKPAMAVVIAKRKKGSVQVVDSKTGKIVYDSEIRRTYSRTPKDRKDRVSSMQQLRLDRRASDAKLRLGKLD